MNLRIGASWLEVPMSDELRPDESTANPTPLTREAHAPRRDRWLMPLIAAGCTLAGVAVGFVMGQRTSLLAHVAPALAERGEGRDLDADDFPGHVFAFNWRGMGHHGFMAPLPPIPPIPPLP